MLLVLSGPIHVSVVVCELGRVILAEFLIVLWCWSGLVHAVVERL